MTEAGALPMPLVALSEGHCPSCRARLVVSAHPSGSQTPYCEPCEAWWGRDDSLSGVAVLLMSFRCPHPERFPDGWGRDWHECSFALFSDDEACDSSFGAHFCGCHRHTKLDFRA